VSFYREQLMNTKSNNWMIKKTIPSDRDQTHSLVELIISQLESKNWDSREQFQIQLAVEETLTNAIEHGNKRDPNKIVKVECEISDEEFHIVVEDEGKGFQRETIIDCTQDDRLELPRGRGVMLIESFMSEVDYGGRGNIVRMRRVKDDPKFVRTSDG
jgi:serine/threonine-protein kinase RsbW